MYSHWLLLLCWWKRKALVNRIENSHRIFMAYLFIRFQHNSFFMSTKYWHYLLKILSVTLSAQVSPVTPTIPDHTEQFQTCVALLTQLLRTKVSFASSVFAGDTRRTRKPQKKKLVSFILIHLFRKFEPVYASCRG